MWIRDYVAADIERTTGEQAVMPMSFEWPWQLHLLLAGMSMFLFGVYMRGPNRLRLIIGTGLGLLFIIAVSKRVAELTLDLSGRSLLIDVLRALTILANIVCAAWFFQSRTRWIDKLPRVLAFAGVAAAQISASGWLAWLPTTRRLVLFAACWSIIWAILLSVRNSLKPHGPFEADPEEPN